MKKILLIGMMVFGFAINGFSEVTIESILTGEKTLIKPSSLGSQIGFVGNVSLNNYLIVNSDNCTFCWNYDHGVVISSLPINKIYIEYRDVSEPKIRFKWIKGIVRNGDFNGAMNNVIYAYVILKKESLKDTSLSTNGYIKVFTDNPIKVVAPVKTVLEKE
jgi:hypothetical protein